MEDTSLQYFVMPPWEDKYRFYKKNGVLLQISKHVEAALEVGRGWKTFEVHIENMFIKGDWGKTSDGNEEHVVGN